MFDINEKKKLWKNLKLIFGNKVKRNTTISLVEGNNRSSHSEMFCKKGVLENFAKFIGKHLCLSLFFNKVAGLRPVTLLKKRLHLFYRTSLVAASGDP